jgi:DNA invertase Pin-like site-specific DNA recombinase
LVLQPAHSALLLNFPQSAHILSYHFQAISCVMYAFEVTTPARPFDLVAGEQRLFTPEAAQRLTVRSRYYLQAFVGQSQLSGVSWSIRCISLTMPSQLDTLAAHGVPRDKFFAEKVSTRVRVRPKFEAALEACRQIKAHAPHCRVILTVYEMKRLGRDSAELTTLADHLTAHGIALEMLAGPLTGIYDSTGTGRVLFAFFAAMAETERENIREAMLEGLNAAARKGHHGGRPLAGLASDWRASRRGRSCTRNRSLK